MVLVQANNTLEVFFEGSTHAGGVHLCPVLRISRVERDPVEYEGCVVVPFGDFSRLCVRDPVVRSRAQKARRLYTRMSGFEQAFRSPQSVAVSVNVDGRLRDGPA